MTVWTFVLVLYFASGHRVTVSMTEFSEIACQRSLVEQRAKVALDVNGTAARPIKVYASKCLPLRLVEPPSI